MTIMGLREARADFSAVLKRVAKGEAITVTRHGVAMAHLMPPKGAAAKAKIGPARKKTKAKSRPKGKAKRRTGRR